MTIFAEPWSDRRCTDRAVTQVELAPRPHPPGAWRGIWEAVGATSHAREYAVSTHFVPAVVHVLQSALTGDPPSPATLEQLERSYLQLHVAFRKLDWTALWQHPAT